MIFQQRKYYDLSATNAFMLAISLLTVFMVTGCGEETGGTEEAETTHGHDHLHIVATTTMIEDLAHQIAGPDAQVIGIMKVGEDPHVYDVRPNDAVSISKADIVFMNGLHLEATLEGVVEQSARGPVVDLTKLAAIDPLGSSDYEGAPDPHCWMDVRLYRKYAEVMRDQLVGLDPEHAEGYRQRATAYLAQLDELEAWIREQWQSIPQDQRVIVTSHDAFNYYAEAYDVQVHGVIGISTDAQPKAADIEAMRQMIQDRGVRALFVETSVAPTLNQIVENIAQATGAQIGGSLFSDSLGGPDSAGATYLDMMRHNTTTMVEALR